jgi:hypothetical protein
MINIINTKNLTMALCHSVFIALINKYFYSVVDVMSGIIRVLLLFALVFGLVRCYEDDPNTFSNYHDI